MTLWIYASLKGARAKRSRCHILLPMRIILKVLAATIAVNIVAGVLATPTKAGTQKGCDGTKERQALQQAEPKDWGSLYRLFKQFGGCDDGAIGEGFSEDVAQLFSKQWAHLDALSRFTTTDKTFEQFVLRHIDATLSDDELRAVGNNARLHCPTGEKRLCQLIRARVQSSLDELRKYSK
jgi:hypothetical protein